METKESLSRKIDLIKLFSGKLQKEIAEELGYSETYLSDITSGRIKITDKFCRTLELKYGGLLNKAKTELISVEKDPAKETMLLLQLQATAAALMNHVAKLESKVLGCDVADCLDGLTSDARLILRDLKTKLEQ